MSLLEKSTGVAKLKCQVEKKRKGIRKSISVREAAYI